MLLIFALAVVCSGVARAAEVMPPPPTDYFNDYANIVSADAAKRLNQELQQFDHDTSNQIVVAIFTTMQSDSSIEDYTVRVAQSWKVGQKLKDNGAVLFVFVASTKSTCKLDTDWKGAARRTVQADHRPANHAAI